MQSPLNVLLVDDNPNDRLLVIRELQHEFDAVEVMQVTEASRFAQLVERGGFDLVITDYQLHWSDGLVVLQSVKARWPEVPVIMFTGTGSEEIAVEAMKAGLDDYILKSPHHYVRLRAAARAVVEQAAARRQMAAALRRSEERYRCLFEDSRDAVYVVALDGSLLEANRATQALFGYSLEELKQQKARDLYVDPRARERFQHDIERSGAVQDYAVQFRKKDGTLLDCLLTATVWRNEHGDIAGYQGIIRDVTQQKRLEAQLRQAQKMEAIGTLAGGIAHDFNNMLGAILGYTELALDDLPSASPVRAYLREVRMAGMRAKDLVQQILTFSRQSVAARQPLQLHFLINEVLSLVRATLPTTIDIRQHVDVQAGTVLADVSQMHQVVLNLCSNAEHAMRQTGGVLEVRLEAAVVDAAFAAAHPPLHPGPHVRLTVRDTGHGIAPEVLERIFEPFYTTKGPGEGTGMGLAVVHGIVAEHGGAISVDSTLGRGTTFSIYLPCMRQPSAGASEPPPTSLPGGTERVLLVEDEPMLAQLGQQMLSRLGYEVEVWTDSLEALEAFRAAPQRFDVVITDQTMPHLTGEALARELRRLRPDIPIILCTGFSHVINEDKARALGINAFLMKPVAMHDLASTVRRLLD